MRNYIFIKNQNAFEVIKDHLGEFTIQSIEISENRKGKVIIFKDSYWAHRLRDFVDFKKNDVSFELAVTPMSIQEKHTAKELVRTLSRIDNELAVMCHEFRIRGDYQTT
jgi:hypothetical protein